MKKEFIFKRLADFVKISVLFSAMIFIASCGDDDDDVPTPVDDPGLVEAANSAGLTVLVDALTEADLTSTLTAEDDLTIFAPTNQAFTDFLAAIGQSSLEDIPQDVLVDVLQYHVVQASAGPIASTDLQPTQSVTTLGGEALTITVSGGTVTLNPDSDDATVSTADVATESGLVHVIDKVLVPPTIKPIVGTIVAPAYFNNDFTTLIAAVEAAPASVLETLLSNGPSDNGLTLFAPTNDAFTAAGITDLSEVADIVTEVLTYHLIDGTFESTDVLGLDPLQAATVNGEEVYFSAVGNDLFINGTTQVTTPNIAGSNGVVHVIDRTLVPPTQSIAGIVTELADEGAGEFTVLLDLIGQAADLPDGTPLVDFLSDASQEVTVFAPIDAAFANVPQETLNSLTAEQIRDVLLYHVVGDAVFSTDLTDGTETTLNGADVTIDVSALTITDANQGVADILPGDNGELINILATNGVIHTIDAVLLPEL